MPVSPADFELYSRVTGVPYPRTPEERAELAPEVYDFARNYPRQPTFAQKTLGAVGNIAKIGGTALAAYGLARALGGVDAIGTPTATKTVDVDRTDVWEDPSADPIANPQAGAETGDIWASEPEKQSASRQEMLNVQSELENHPDMAPGEDDNRVPSRAIHTRVSERAIAPSGLGKEGVPVGYIPNVRMKDIVVADSAPGSEAIYGEGRDTPGKFIATEGLGIDDVSDPVNYQGWYGGKPTQNLINEATDALRQRHRDVYASQVAGEGMLPDDELIHGWQSPGESRFGGSEGIAASLAGRYKEPREKGQANYTGAPGYIDPEINQPVRVPETNYNFNEAINNVIAATEGESGPFKTSNVVGTVIGEAVKGVDHLGRKAANTVLGVIQPNPTAGVVVEEAPRGDYLRTILGRPGSRTRGMTVDPNLNAISVYQDMATYNNSGDKPSVIQQYPSKVLDERLIGALQSMGDAGELTDTLSGLVNVLSGKGPVPEWEVTMRQNVPTFSESGENLLAEDVGSYLREILGTPKDEMSKVKRGKLANRPSLTEGIEKDQWDDYLYS